GGGDRGGGGAGGRADSLEGARGFVLYPARAHVGGCEEAVHRQGEPGESLDAARGLDRQVKPDPPPERERPIAAEPQADAEKELRRDGQLREAARDAGVAEPGDDARRDAGLDRVLPVKRHSRREDAAVAPVGVEELRAARREVDDRDLNLREARGPEGPDARADLRGAARPSRRANPRAAPPGGQRVAVVAGRERQEEGVAGHRPPVVMKLNAVTEEHVGA